jgi:flagellar biosynthesis/type III secretory pathway chaperone
MNKVTEDQRQQMIAEAAYFLAERRGFNGGDSVADWIEAEAEVDERLRRIDAASVLESLTDGVESATKKLAEMKRKASTLASGARVQVNRDIDRLGELRDSLRVKVKELRAQGEHAGDVAVQQAERVWQELADAMRRMSQSARH